VHNQLWTGWIFPRIDTLRTAYSGEEIMKCPNCQHENPDGISRCDCGYNFETRTVQKYNIAPAPANRPPRLSVQDLQGIESRLNRGFFAAVGAFVFCLFFNGVYGPMIRDPRANKLSLALAILLCLLLAFAGYVWYVISIYQTAKAINKSGGLYLAWAILGPVLSLLPIPIVSLALSVSPLVIKFLLSNEIRTMTRLQTLRDLH
jgi:hypothetical protein